MCVNVGMCVRVSEEVNVGMCVRVSACERGGQRRYVFACDRCVCVCVRFGSRASLVRASESASVRQSSLLVCVSQRRCVCVRVVCQST